MNSIGTQAVWSAVARHRFGYVSPATTGLPHSTNRSFLKTPRSSLVFPKSNHPANLRRSAIYALIHAYLRHPKRRRAGALQGVHAPILSFAKRNLAGTKLRCRCGESEGLKEPVARGKRSATPGTEFTENRSRRDRRTLRAFFCTPSGCGCSTPGTRGGASLTRGYCRLEPFGFSNGPSSPPRVLAVSEHS